MFDRVRFLAFAIAMFGLIAASPAQEPQQPTMEHKALARLAGTWDVVMKGAGADNPGVATFTVECGGLWIVNDFKSHDGSFTGKGLDTYDPATKKFISVWVDSMSTTPMTFEGRWDEESKTLTQTAEGPGPDGKPAKYRSVTRHKDPDHMVFEMFLTRRGVDTKVVTMEYTRRN